jgi:hypothetical protein
MMFSGKTPAWFPGSIGEYFSSPVGEDIVGLISSCLESTIGRVTVGKIVTSGISFADEVGEDRSPGSDWFSFWGVATQAAKKKRLAVVIKVAWVKARINFFILPGRIILLLLPSR